MPRTLRNSHIKFLSALLLLLSITVSAQEEQQNNKSLVSYIKEVEDRFDVKFSYLNEDLENLELPSNPGLTSLDAILEYLESQYQIKVEKLSDRYYGISQNTLVNVCGYVLDNFAENTVSGATLEVLGDETAQITDENGAFILNNVSRDASLRIRYLGYTTKVVTIEELLKEKGCSKILLAQQYERLNEVIVYEYLTAGIIKETDASITLNTADFGILPGLIEPDILQTIQALPGIKSIDETVSDINVRGGTNDQNLILWNGIKMYQSGHFFGLISAFNPYLTDKVTVIKNGTPAAFGDGVSSVIQMETNNDITDYFTGGAGINLISGDVFGQIPLAHNMGFQFSARRSTTDFLNTPTYNNFFDRAFQDSEVTNQNNITVDEDIDRNENFFFYDFTGKFLYDVNDDHKIRLNFISINNTLDYEEINRSRVETTRSILEQNNFSIGGQWFGRWTDRLSSHLNVYYSNYNLDAQSIFANQVQILNQKNIVDERAVKFDTQYRLLDNLGWSNGFQYIETGIVNRAFVSQPNFDTNSKGVVRIYAPYSELSYSSFQNRFIAKVGARVNLIENLDTFSKILVEPRLNLNFRLANYLRAEVLGEFKSQTTNQVIDLEQNFLGIEKRRWILSDDNVLPITKSRQGSAGINYDKNNLYLGLEAFYKEVDGISTQTQGFQNQNQFNGEIGSYDIKGIEFLVNKRGDNYSTWLSYTYNQSDYTFETIIPNTFPNNLDITHTLTFAGTYTYNDLKLSLGINYRTGRPITEPLEGDQALDTSVFPTRINYQPPNSSRLPDYFRADASAVYKFNLSQTVKANAGISLLNITNRKNALNQYYRLNDDDEIETVQNVSLGLTPNVSFRVSF